MKRIIHILLCVSLVFLGETPAVWGAADKPERSKEASTRQKGPTKSAPAEKTTKQKAATSTDVALQGKQGTLLGQVVDTSGKPVAATTVSLRHGNRVVAKGKTDSNGQFAFNNLRGGVYQVLAANSFGTFRVWARGTAPKSAKPRALVVAGQPTIRGQEKKGERGARIRRWLRNPLVLAGIIGTAVAVPLSVHDSKGDESGNPVAAPEALERVTEGPAS
jgi:hypothetical protein